MDDISKQKAAREQDENQCSKSKRSYFSSLLYTVQEFKEKEIIEILTVNEIDQITFKRKRKLFISGKRLEEDNSRKRNEMLKQSLGAFWGRRNRRNRKKMVHQLSQGLQEIQVKMEGYSQEKGA